MPAWANFASELEAAAIAAVTADPIVGVGGTMGVLEVVQLQAVSGEYIFEPSQLPSIGIAAVSALPQDLATIDEVRVRLVAICTVGPTETLSHEDARAVALGMGARVVKVLKDWHGTAPGASGHQVLVRDTSGDEVSVDDDDLTLSVAVEVLLGALHVD